MNIDIFFQAILGCGVVIGLIGFGFWVGRDIGRVEGEIHSKVDLLGRARNRLQGAARFLSGERNSDHYLYQPGMSNEFEFKECFFTGPVIADFSEGWAVLGQVPRLAHYWTARGDREFRSRCNLTTKIDRHECPLLPGSIPECPQCKSCLNRAYPEINP